MMTLKEMKYQQPCLAGIVSVRNKHETDPIEKFLRKYYSTQEKTNENELKWTDYVSLSDWSIRA